MFIFYGTRGKNTKKYVEYQEECKACGETNHIVMSFLRYFHIFWIPVFITKRQLQKVCLHCKKAVDVSDMPSVTMVKSELFAFKNVWGYYFGLYVIAIILIIGMFS